ncbi:MAG: Fe-S protein assembly chaperone HscA [Gammaproteobacteria bacterium AqS3]|nr:Fe-S protein assembly chaperone HscA [Gammaproteobacteria bacterium AqS3]
MSRLLQISEPTPAPRVVGIDLGTTYSLVARPLGGGAAEVIRGGPLPGGHPRPRTESIASSAELLPSSASWDEAGRIRIGGEGAGFIRSAKRMVGLGMDELPESLVREYALSPGPQDTVRIDTPSGAVSPVQVSAEILRALAERAEISLGGPLDGAVITVPAFFNDAQRQATRDAARLAGIPVLRLLNEPTAAALAYGLDSGAQTGRVLVYDLGGGTFDISILQLADGVFEVLSTSGDTALGGDDFDALLAVHIESRIGRDAPAHLLGTLGRRVKEQLSERERTSVSLCGWQGEITRADFEAMSAPLIERTLDICRDALRQADLQVGDIDHVVLVGGSTRMPLISERLEAMFERCVHRDIDPDRVVALGAAVQAGLLSGIDQSEALLLDVTPLSLGVETAGELVDVIIPRNTPIPVSQQTEFTTGRDGQTGLIVHVVQGESPLVQECRSLARFTLRGLPPLAAGVARIAIQFSIDADGILQVEAEEQTTGARTGIEVTPVHGLTEDDILEMLRTSGTDEQEREAALRRARSDAEQVLHALGRALVEDARLLIDGESDRIQTASENLARTIQGDDPEAIADALQALEQSAEHFSQRRMDTRISQALAGEHKDAL